MSNNNGISVPALRIVDNITAGQPDLIDELIKLKYLDRALCLLGHPK
jgi:hypothetical protein